ncbi:potassium transporter TrkA [Natronococcus pandeyae]|uniref:Potassium transporter TrkA n=1 Tax=Natronococcus pandeyae TaxID=2055836 RepID=A0A8J8TMT4_9EURY|nr:NAD-binding protein [Natronococcus pandeyae]TYL35931.1 potassium transporter TrkA [Natronococcus pandeyae]
MVRLTYRLAGYLGSLLFLIGVYATVYQWGMATLEGEPRSWYRALEVVVQSMTTTGYGQDAPWETLEMTLLMMLIQLTGITYIFVAVPLFVVPWLQTIVQPTPPEHVSELEDHVIVVGYTDLCDTLVDELEASGTPYVILEADEDRAQELHQDGLTVLHDDPKTEGALDAAQLEDATAVVVDATEREFVRTILAVEERDPDASVFVLVADPSRARYFRYAGVDEVLSPKHRLGKALGDRVRDVVEPDLGDEIELGEAFDVVEFLVDADADLFGETVASSRRLEETGATVLGAWVRGDFVTTLSERVRIDRNTALLVAGTESQLEEVAELTGSTGHRYRMAADPVVVIGSGLVGGSVYGSLERAGLETVVVDREAGEHVDVVGDATTEETLLEAGIEDAGTLVIALETDDDAILTALTARELNPDLEIIVGANTAESVSALRTAGADYVLALPNVAGRMVTLRVFEREVMTLGDRLHLRQLDASEIVGDELSEAAVRRETGCTVVALERDGDLHTDVDGMRFEADDSLVVAGTDRQIGQFRDAYGAD